MQPQQGVQGKKGKFMLRGVMTGAAVTKSSLGCAVDPLHVLCIHGLQ